ncbi:MAG TPA: PKD domain-containing protein, partial [Candidatus Thermoplasmatota archaeon]|nr:PKD domain-containing protein [Candidatus Thermoplasmatota archaeon]
TPVVVVDPATGLAATLAATLAAQPTGLVSFGNPLKNAGFEVDGLVEGSSHYFADGTAYGGTMTSPPWFLRLDDAGAGAPTNPKSTHRVVAASSITSGKALQVNYNAADNGKTLMLGQLFGTGALRDGLVYEGAKAASFDVKVLSGTITLSAAVRHFNAANQSVSTQMSSVTLTASSLWQTVRVTLPTPVTGQIVGFYLLPTGTQNAAFLVDNVVLEGTTTTLGDARTDLTDGFAMIITPRGLTGGFAPSQGVFMANGVAYYLYDITAVDYRNGAAKIVKASEFPANHRSFGYMTDKLTKNVGTVMTLRNDPNTVVAVVPASLAPGIAAPWAWLRATDAWDGIDGVKHQSVSGYYSPLKNALAGNSIADHLDYAGTPVQLTTTQAGGLTKAQTVQLVLLSGGSYGVKVTTDSPFVETTTVTVRKAGVPTTYTVTLDNPAGNMVSGLTILPSELDSVTITTANTLFTTGSYVAPGSPTADFTFCLRVAGVCTSDPITTASVVNFTSTSVIANGESATYRYYWNDGTAPSGGPDATHRFVKPGTYNVTLMVTTYPSSKVAAVTKPVVVQDRAPSVTLSLSPASPTVFDTVTATATATDPDFGTVFSYEWTLNSVFLANYAGASLAITPAVLQDAGLGSKLVKGATYTVGVTVKDGHGMSDTETQSFTVGDLALTLSDVAVSTEGITAPEYFLVGEAVAVSAVATDLDDAESVLVTATLTGPGNFTETQNMTPTATWATLAAGVYTVTVTATNGVETLTSDPVTFEVRENSAPTVTLAGPTVLQPLEAATFTAEGADPDARGPVTYAWFVDGVEQVGATGATFVFTAGASAADHTIVVVVTDADGLTSEAEMNFSVDDAISVSITVYMPINGPTTVVVIVTDDLGNGVGNALVNLTAFGPLGYLYSQQEGNTSGSGMIVFTVKPFVGDVLNLPGDYRFVAKVQAASRAGAALQDTETVEKSQDKNNIIGLS